MQLIVCQWDVIWCEPERNIERVSSLLHAVESSDGALVILPEMYATGFAVCEPTMPDRSAKIAGDYLRRLAIARRAFVLGGVARRCAADGLAVNIAQVVAPDGRIIAEYEKLHPFRPGDEQRLYRAGQELVRFAWGEHWVSPFICYDLRFPEVFRAAVRSGAVLLVVLANWPAMRVEHWVALLRARAIENQAYVVGVNRIGQDPHVAYPGRSLVVDPKGEIIADAGELETALSIELDLEAAIRWRAEFPVLDDARPDALAGQLPMRTGIMS